MKYFRQGGFLYGIVYLIWRGYLHSIGLLSTWFYRRVVGKCGQDVVFGAGTFISFPRNVEIGSHVIIGPEVRFSSETPDSKLIIGDYVKINSRVSIDFTGGVVIKEKSLLSSDAHILSHDHGYDPFSVPTVTQVVLENNVWVGMSAVILPGAAHIGSYAIIATGAVVTKPVPQGAIVGGMPAKVIKTREIPA